MIRTITLFLIFFQFLFLQVLPAQPSLVLETFASGFSAPVDIAHAGDDRIFIVEKGGVIQVVAADGSVRRTPFLDIRDRVNDNGNEQGLLGLAFHPDYATNGFFFVNYTDSGGDTRVSRFSRRASDAEEADPGSERILLTVDQPRTNHNGGDLAFGPDGYLYISLGDGGGAGDPDNLAQNTNSLLGKMLRIDVNIDDGYSIPPDNPFVNAPGVRDEIWALGLRNPWRFSFDRTTGDLWIADVGQVAREEINYQPAFSSGGENYGWRCYEGYEVYNPAGCPNASELRFPVYAYAHRAGNCGGSVTGGYVYRGTKHPDLAGHYVYADYCTGKINSIIPDGADSWNHFDLLSWAEGQAVAFGEDAEGELLLAAIRRGVIYRVMTTVSDQDDALLGLTSVRLAPNPFRETLHLSGQSERRGDFEILLYDTQGRLVFQREEPLPANFSREYDLQGLAPGVYFLRIRQGEKSRSWRIVKQ